MKKNGRILVIDDDPGILQLLKIMLESHDFEVLVLQSGKGVVKKVKSFAPAVVFLDIWMPGIDGVEIAKLLKKDTSTKDIPIILLSALSKARKLSQSIQVEGFLAKPFEMEELIRIAKKYAK